MVPDGHRGKEEDQVINMTALQCDAAAIYDKRKDNLRFFLDNLPTHACHVQPNFNLCTVCFKINLEVARGCPVYQRFNQGIIDSKVKDPLHIDLARSIDLAQPEEELEAPEGVDQEFPLFEFSTPSVHTSILDEEIEEDEVMDAEVLEAEVVEEEEPPKPVVKPAPKAPPQAPAVPKPLVAPKPPVEEKKPVQVPTAPAVPPKPIEKKAPEAAKPTEPAAPPKPVVKTIKKVKMVVKAPPPPPTAPKPQQAPKPVPLAGIKELPKGGPGDSPVPGPQPLEPHPDVTPPPPGPYPGPSPEPDDDDDYDEEDMAILKDLEQKAPQKPLVPPPPRAEAKPATPPGPPKALPPKGGVPPLFATLGKLETKKKPDE